MSTLDFQDREPELNRAHGPDSQFLSGNNAFYARLQGQGRKSALERYGWIAVPVAVVAIIGVVAATSTQHQSANDVTGPAAQTTASASTPSNLVNPPVNEAQATEQSAQTAEASTAQSQAAKTPAASPAPVRVARRAPDASSSRPASAAAVERTVPVPETPVTPAPAPSIAPTIQAPAPTITQDAAPQPAAPAPSTDSSPPADAQPAQ